MPLLIVPVLVVLGIVAFIPIALVQRYRMGVARQRARGWLATINVIGFGLSGVMFMVTAAMTTIWIHGAFAYTIGGLATGYVLGLAGLWLTRWESTPAGLYFTPNRWLVLGYYFVYWIGVRARLRSRRASRNTPSTTRPRLIPPS